MYSIKFEQTGNLFELAENEELQKRHTLYFKNKPPVNFKGILLAHLQDENASLSKSSKNRWYEYFIFLRTNSGDPEYICSKGAPNSGFYVSTLIVYKVGHSNYENETTFYNAYKITITHPGKTSESISGDADWMLDGYINPVRPNYFDGQVIHYLNTKHGLFIDDIESKSVPVNFEPPHPDFLLYRQIYHVLLGGSTDTLNMEKIEVYGLYRNKRFNPELNPHITVYNYDKTIKYELDAQIDVANKLVKLATTDDVFEKLQAKLAKIHIKAERSRNGQAS